MKEVVLVTGASSGFGLLTAQAREHGVDLRTVELKVGDDASVNAAIEPADADAGTIATAIADIVAAPAGARIASSSIRRRTARRKCSASAIASAARCSGTSVSPTCSRPASAADPSRAGHAGTPQPCSQNPRIASATAAGASRCGK